MHIDIAASIREVLDNMEAVSINALGTLQLKHIPAYFSDKGTTLSPPSMVLDVKDNITPNGPLVKAIANNYGITKDAAKKLVSSFNKKLLNNLLNYKKVSIEGVALITRSDKGQVKIETTSGFVEAYYNELPKVKTIPNVKAKTVIPPPVEIVAPPVVKAEVKKSKPIGSSIVTNSDSKNAIKKTAVKESVVTKQGIIDKTAEILPIQSSQAKTEFKSTSPKTETTIAPPVYQASDSSQPIKPFVYEEKKPSLLWPLILLMTVLLLLLLCFKMCSKYAFTNDNKSADPEMTITDVDILDGVTATDSISAEALMDLRKDNSIIPASGNCKIITGVFSRTINVIAMKDKLREAGYDIYTEPIGEYTRVGLEFKCNEETDLKAYLLEVRRKIAARAWYLDPSLYVDYIN